MLSVLFISGYLANISNFVLFFPKFRYFFRVHKIYLFVYFLFIYLIFVCLVDFIQPFNQEDRF